MTTRDNIKVDFKYSQDRQLKIRKPKYGLNDYGCPVPQNQESMLPIDNIFENTTNFSESDVAIYVMKNSLSLRRVNNESDVEYDGSIDESTNRILSLDVVEPLEENQYSQSLCFRKEDLEYALKKCQVIRKNRLIYKKYKSKEESTSDESEINMLVQDICRTSDEDILVDVAVLDEPTITEITRSCDIFQKDSLRDQQDSDINLIEKNIMKVLDIDDQESKVPYAEQNNEINMNDYNTPEIKKFDNSRNLRQMAKLKFCTEPPKPVSINPKEFISQINHNKMLLVNTPCYLEVAEYLPSLNDIFVTVTSQFSALCAQIVVLEKSILSASILSIHDHDCNLKAMSDLVDESNLSNQFNISVTTDYVEDQSILIRKNKCNTPQNIFSEAYDIKDIDSLSVNTEDSNATHSEIISENEIRKNNVPLKCGHYRKATLDSELDLSMGRFSVSEIPIENRFCSNNSLNSIPLSSLNSSVKSDISASSESDGKKYNNKNLQLNEQLFNSADAICPKTINQMKFFPNSLNKKFRKSKSSKFGKNKNHNINKNISNNLQSSEEMDFISEIKLNSVTTMPHSLFCNTVTPPHDIELDDIQVKCLKVDAEFHSAIESSLPLMDIDNISTKFQRVNDIHKQLENIEDKINELQYKDIDFKDISNNQNSSEIFHIRNKSKSDQIFQDDSNTYINDKRGTVDERIVMGFVL